MWKYLLILAFIITTSLPKAIYTPAIVDEVSLNVPAPDGWAVKHYNVNAGLKAIFWPIGFNPINTDIMVFVFIGNKSNPARKLENMDPFRYKCPGMGMKKIPDVSRGSENSLETYFKGRCGRGMALMHIDEGYFSVLILMVSSQYLTTNQSKALASIGKRYKDAMIKAMGKDYYMVRDGVNEAVRGKVRPDYQVELYGADKRPINREVETKIHQTEAQTINTDGNKLKTSVVLEKSQQTTAEKSKAGEPVNTHAVPITPEVPPEAQVEVTQPSTPQQRKAVVVNG